MKRSISLVFFVITILIFVGCSKTTPSTPSLDVKSVNSYTTKIEKDKKNNLIKIEVNEKVYNSILRNSYDRDFYEFFVAFEKVSEILETSYFVLLNPEVSNYEGSPINNLYGLKDYIFPNKVGYHKNIRILKRNLSLKTHDLVLFIQPIEEKNINFVVWNAEELRNNIKKFKLEYKIR